MICVGMSATDESENYLSKYNQIGGTAPKAETGRWDLDGPARMSTI
jgi:hypothetical protein